MKKKEQFSIALWDRLQKDNIPHSFETRNGKEVTQVVYFNCKEPNPILGVFNYEIYSWDINGKYLESRRSNTDLFLVWEEEQLMLDAKLYTSVSGERTLDYDIATMPSFRLISIKKVSIPYTKGEGLNNPTTN